MEWQGIRRTGALSVAVLSLPWDRRMLALGLLGVAAMLDRYTVTLGGLHAKAEHLVLLALGAMLVWSLLRGGDRSVVRALGWIGAYVAVTLLASLLNAPDRYSSFWHTVMIALVATAAWVAYWAADTPARLRASVRLMILLGIIQAITVVVGLASSWFDMPFGQQPGQGEIVVPYGTMWEPNILGSYLAASASLLLPVLLAQRKRTSAYRWAAGFAVVLVALGLSLARAAWLGFGTSVLICVGAFLWSWRGHSDVRGHPWKPFVHNARLVGIAALAAVLFLAGATPLLFPLTARGLAMRVSLGPYNVPRDPSLQARVSSSLQAFDGIAAHPLMGNGAGSYAVGHPNEKGEPGWLSNLELHMIYDSGLIGVGVVLVGLSVAARTAWRGLQRTPSYVDQIRPELIGLLAAGTALVVAFQATEGTWLAFPWIYVGLLARAGRLAFATSAEPMQYTRDSEPEDVTRLAMLDRSERSVAL